MGYAGWTTTLRAVQKGTPLFIAGQNHTGGAEYLVASLGIKSPADLVGKRVSFGTDPEENNLNWVEWAEQLGIPADITLYENYNMSDKDEYFALKADAYICCDPGIIRPRRYRLVVIRQIQSGWFQGTCCK